MLENDGNRVKLDDVPEDWETPVELPNRPGEKIGVAVQKEVWLNVGRYGEMSGYARRVENDSI